MSLLTLEFAICISKGPKYIFLFNIYFPKGRREIVASLMTSSIVGVNEKNVEPDALKEWKIKVPTLYWLPRFYKA